MSIFTAEIYNIRWLKMCIIYFGTLVLPYISICIATIPTSTLMTSQGSDTVTFIFKYNSSNTIKSLRLLKMA